jgi:hypothetical protein
VNGEPWHLDKRVPVAIIFALLIQTAGAVWWASAMSSSVAALREADSRLEAADVQIRIDATSREARLRLVEQGATRMETKLEAIVEGINRLSVQIDRLIESQP